MNGEKQKLHQKRGMVPVKEVQQVAGLLSWATGVLPYVKPFNGVGEGERANMRRYEGAEERQVFQGQGACAQP